MGHPNTAVVPRAVVLEGRQCESSAAILSAETLMAVATPSHVEEAATVVAATAAAAAVADTAAEEVVAGLMLHLSHPECIPHCVISHCFISIQQRRRWQRV